MKSLLQKVESLDKVIMASQIFIKIFVAYNKRLALCFSDMELDKLRFAFAAKMIDVLRVALSQPI